MTGRVARLLLALLTWASVLLCVALVVLWVRSYCTRTVVEFWRSDGLWEVVSDKGRMRVDNEPQKRLDEEHALKLHQKWLDDDDRIRDQWVAEFKREVKSSTEKQRRDAELTRIVELRNRIGEENLAEFNRVYAG